MKNKKKKKNKNKWIRKRHGVVRNVVCLFLKPYSILKYGIKVEPFREQGKRSYLVLYNHQTAFDQFFVGMCFKGPVYYLATEDIFSKGFVSSLIRWLVAPIPIKKQTTDVKAILNCIRVAKEGGTIAIAPEGNRTYSGKTEYMSPAIASLAKKLGLPIAICRIEGGYGVQPRWSDSVRKGRMRSYVSQVIEPEVYKSLSDDELFLLIEKGLYVDENRADAEFLSSKRAEFLERAIYYCPFCGFSRFESSENEMECKKCSRKVVYGKDKKLSGVGFDLPYSFVGQWYDSQKEYLNSVDVTKYTDEPLFCDRANISKVIVYKKKEPLYEDCEIRLYGDRIIVIKNEKAVFEFPFTDVGAVSVLGKNKLNVYYNDDVYQFKGSKHFNALKYVNIYYRYKNIIGGDENVQFLGL